MAMILSSAAAWAQSTDQNYPTAISFPEISGAIRARDMGDARLTTYYYAFSGRQGDIFVNVVTKNFTGDIDVFNADGVRPLTKMVIYTGAEPGETGRLIYLRKSERLLLRIQGRSPNDDPATYRIKFGGSFVALAAGDIDDAPTIAGAQPDGAIRVNSVGTILPPVGKPVPERKPKQTVVESTAVNEPPVIVDEEKLDPAPAPGKGIGLPRAAPPARTSSRRGRTTAARPAQPPVRVVRSTPPPVEKKPDPLASIRLSIQLKAGETIYRPMSEVLRFSVNNGVLVVVGKDGKTSRYSILDVAKVTIE